MFPSEIRMAPTKTNQTGRVNNPVSSHLPINNSNSVPNKARRKVTSSNKWKDPTKTGARERKTITGRNSIKEVEEEAEVAVAEVAVAGDDTWHNPITGIRENLHIVELAKSCIMFILNR